MDTSIYDQLFKGDSCDLASHRVKPREDNCFRSIIDDKIDAGHCLDRADISSFTTDDPSLHLIVRKLNDRNRRLCNVIYGASLNRTYDDLSGFLFRIVLGLFDQLTIQLCHIHLHVILHSLVQEFLGFLCGHARDSLQFLDGLIV